MGYLLNSFNEHIELGRYLVTPLNRPQATMSGESTRSADEPKRYIKVKFLVWNYFADNALQSMANNGYLSNDQSPRWNDKRYINVEGDVAEASSLYLLHAIDSVLSKYLPSSEFCFLCQHTVNVDNHTVRADRIWGFTDPFSLDMLGYFAVLDFKRPTLIDQGEFGHLITWNDYCEINISEYSESAIVTNATILLKQAVSYSHRYQTKFIAFFDWHTLVLIVLADAEFSNGGEYCFITFVTDRKKMRRALLGFLIRAYNAGVGAVEGYTDIIGSENSGEKPLPKGKGSFFGKGGGESSRHRRR